MRYNEPVFFQCKTPGVLDLETHNYSEDIIAEDMKRADITESDTKTLQLVYGTVKQQSLTIRLQRPYTKAFDSIRIGSKTYRVDFSRRKKVFVISEVQ